MDALSQNIDKQRHPLRVFLSQSEKLMTLTEQLDMITATSIEMQGVMFEKLADVKKELEEAR